jgi:hypothetical protein
MAKKKAKQAWFNHQATKLGASTVWLVKKQPPLPQPKAK